MEKYEPLFVISLASVTIVILNKVWPKSVTAQQTQRVCDPIKPQKQFTKFIRDNINDNTQEFFTQKHFQDIHQRISTLNPEQLLKTDPNIQPAPFLDNNYHYIDTEEELKKFAQSIIKHYEIIGVDIEQTYLNSYQGYNCLIQISTLTKDYIIDAIKLHDIIPQYLKPIFEDENIVKVFYACGSDLQWLNRDHGIFVVNFFDVHIARVFLDKRQDSSLVGLLDQYCGYKLDRVQKKKYQVSDWRVRPLSQNQLNYAALDSHYLIYLRNAVLEQIKQSKKADAISLFLKEMQRLSLKPYELKPVNLAAFVDHFNKESASIKDQDNKRDQDGNLIRDVKRRVFLTLCKLRDVISRNLDVNPDQVCSINKLFSLAIQSHKDITKEIVETMLVESEEDLTLLKDQISQITEVLQGNSLVEFDKTLETKAVSSSKEDKKALRRQVQEQRFTLKRDLYENCQVLAPDGELITYTNRKKINWYLSKGIATLVKEEPLTIKLLFEPAGRGYPDKEDFQLDNKTYMEKERMNRCVVCGQEQKLTRYHVIPVQYRQYLPIELKSHNPHDVLLLCFRCQEKAGVETDKFKVEIAKRYDVPLVDFEKHQEIKSTVGSMQKLVATYSKYKEKLTKEKKDKVKQQIQETFQTIRTAPGLSEETVAQFSKFKFEADQTVKIDEAFVDFFTKLESYKALVTKTSNRDFKNIHGKLVVEKLQALGELRNFIYEWRSVFISTMDPQFLPHDWQVVQKAGEKVDS